jgi:hypothetical protein
MIKSFFPLIPKIRQIILGLAAILLVAVVGTISLVVSHAASPVISVTADSGTLTGAAALLQIV